MLQEEANYTYTENNFILKLDSSRHTASGKNILLEMTDSGILKEVIADFGNVQIPERMNKPIPNYYERESPF